MKCKNVSIILIFFVVFDKFQHHILCEFAVMYTKEMIFMKNF